MPNIFGLYILLSCFFFINSLIYICLLVPHIWKSVGTKNFLLTVLANPVLYPTLRSAVPPMPRPDVKHQDQRHDALLNR